LPSTKETLFGFPEVEGTVWDGIALELEVEFSGSRQKGLNFASQITLGRGFGGRFIHGVQVRAERDNDEKSTELVALYIPAFRFNPTWSTLVMVGARVPLEGDDNGDTKLLFNASVFAEPNDSLVLGIECDYRGDTRRSDSLSVIPQALFGFTDHFSVQVGLGMTFADQPTKAEAMFRVTYSF
jgi:hypothetical protein